METIKIIKLNNCEYYLSDDIMNCNKKFEKYVNGRELTKNENVPLGEYIYAKKIGNEYEKSNGTSKKFDKILIKKSYVDTKILNNMNTNDNNDNKIDNKIDHKLDNNDNVNNVNKMENINKNKHKKDNNKNDKNNKKEIKINNQDIEENNKDVKEEEENNEDIRIAPELLYLNDDEKFKDDNGNIIEIETRGSREYDKIFFRVSDIAKGFNIDKLHTILINKQSAFVNERDYCFFIFSINYGKNKKNNTKINKNKNKKEKTNEEINKENQPKKIFLTYEGILRVLFVSRNNKTTRFIKWATQTLFTHQMGTIEQKNKLASDLLGISASIMKEVLNTDANTLPCIYLFTIGYVKDLRQSMNIDPKYADNFIIAKYGFTKDLKRRTSEHMNNYGKIKNADLKLKYYSYIDPQYVSDGENDIKDFFGALNMSINYDNTKEIVIIDQKIMNLIKDQYTNISRKYAGHISELITKIKEMENELENAKKHYEQSIELINEKHTRELLQKEKENELLQKDNELQKERFINELLKKDLEIAKLLYGAK